MILNLAVEFVMDLLGMFKVVLCGVVDLFGVMCEEIEGC